MQVNTQQLNPAKSIEMKFTEQNYNTNTNRSPPRLNSPPFFAQNERRLRSGAKSNL